MKRTPASRLKPHVLRGLGPRRPTGPRGASFTSWKLFRVSPDGQGIVVPEAWAATCRVSRHIRYGRAGRSGDDCATACAKPRRDKGLQPTPALRALWTSGAQPPSRPRHMAFRCPQDRWIGRGKGAVPSAGTSACQAGMPRRAPQWRHATALVENRRWGLWPTIRQVRWPRRPDRSLRVSMILRAASRDPSRRFRAQGVQAS